MPLPCSLALRARRPIRRQPLVAGLCLLLASLWLSGCEPSAEQALQPIRLGVIVDTSGPALLQAAEAVAFLRVLI